MDIKLYTMKRCHFCEAVKDFLEKHNIEFQEIVLDDDREMQRYIKDRTGFISAPILEADDEFVVGYDIPKLKKLFGIK